MLAGHLHRQVIRKQDSAVHFPVIVNSNNNVLRVDLNETKGTIKIIDPAGKTIEEILLTPAR